MWTEPDTDVDATAIGLPGEDVRLRGVMMIGDSTEGVGFEFHQYLSPTGPARRTNGASTVRRICELGPNHVAWRTWNIAEAHDYLQGCDVVWNSAPNLIETGPLAGRRWCYGIDPWGNVIELCQYPGDDDQDGDEA